MHRGDEFLEITSFSILVRLMESAKIKGRGLSGPLVGPTTGVVEARFGKLVASLLSSDLYPPAQGRFLSVSLPDRNAILTD